ncbi:MAG: TorF family putative porin [Minwuia sp.]|uniref:TorF family putative porin n=1 Tax=Minwuia sp. TaxID=2493630 RepID=UPI003A84C6A3
MKKLIAMAGVGLALGMASLQPVLADEEEMMIPGEFSANVAFLTDYRFRGITQTQNEPAIQGGFDWAHDSGIYLGTWASNVEFNDAHIEMDFYGGYANTVGNFSYDLGVIYYWYPGARRNQDFDFVEVALGMGYDFEVASVSLGMNYSPENFGASGDAFYTEAGVAVPLPYDFELGATIGYQIIDDEATFGVPDYLNWSVSLARSFYGFDFGLAYVDTDEGSCGDGCGATVIFSVSRSF